MSSYDNLPGYYGQPCVYVRYLEATDQFYIGATNNLFVRYQGARAVLLKEIIYFETFGEPVRDVPGKRGIRKVCRRREAQLIAEFLAEGLPLANVVLGRRLL